MRRAILTALRPMGAFLHQAASGLEAIEYLRTQSYHILILDLNLTDMHGLEVLQYINNVPGLVRPAIIVTSDQEDKRVRQKALELGAVAYLTKPLLMEELRQTVAALLV